MLCTCLNLIMVNGSLRSGLKIHNPIQIYTKTETKALGLGFASFYKPRTVSMAGRLSPPDLPVEVVIDILSHLPIAEAVRTSILSRSWRHHWRSIRDFAFNFDDGLDIAAVDHVLGLHSAPIQSFSLSNTAYRVYSKHLHRWLAALYADPLPLRSLTLDLPTRSMFALRLSFSNLNHLRLCGCSLPSYSFGRVGFPVLETLYLSDCTPPGYDSSKIYDLIIDCPLLQKLTLLDMECMTLSICAPKLCSFVFKGALDDFALDSGPLLTTVVINLHEFYGGDETKELIECSLIKALVDARSIKKLHLSLRFLTEFRIPNWIPDSFERLNVLTLTVDFSVAEEILVLLCLLRSTPNLHEIKFKGLECRQETLGLGHEFWQAQDHLELSKLRTLKLTHTACDEPMLEFIDYILPKARELKKMEINICPSTMACGTVGKLSNSKELVQYWRASTRAQIIFTGEFLSECAITSSGSDVALSVWDESISWKEFNEHKDHIESELQGIGDRLQKIETDLWGRVQELNCQITFLLQAIPPEKRDALVQTMVHPEHRDTWMRSFGAAYRGLGSGASDPSTAVSTNNNGVGTDR